MRFLIAKHGGEAAPLYPVDAIASPAPTGNVILTFWKMPPAEGHPWRSPNQSMINTTGIIFLRQDNDTGGSGSQSYTIGVLDYLALMEVPIELGLLFTERR